MRGVRDPRQGPTRETQSSEMQALAELGEMKIQAPDLRSESGYAPALRQLTTFKPVQDGPQPQEHAPTRLVSHFEFCYTS